MANFFHQNVACMKETLVRRSNPSFSAKDAGWTRDSKKLQKSTKQYTR